MRTAKTAQIVRKLVFDGARISIAYGTPSSGNFDACLFLAHGVRSTMNSSNISYLHEELARRGFLTVKFNFPFAEGRARFLKRSNSKNVLVESYRRVVEAVRESEWKPKNLYLGGISLGAAVASHVVSDGPAPIGVRGLFFLAYPLNLPRKPDAVTDSHLDKISIPMLFVSGTRDIYADERTLKSTVSRLGSKAQLHLVYADHGFNRRSGMTLYSKTLT